jgi:hypothetical protein
MTARVARVHKGLARYGDELLVVVVNGQISSAARPLPAMSLTPLGPPLSVAVWAVLASRFAVGSNVALLVVGS